MTQKDIFIELYYPSVLSCCEFVSCLGRIETGFRFEAKKKLEETHQIPIEDPSWTQGEKDYGKLFNEIRNFLCVSFLTFLFRKKSLS